MTALLAGHDAIELTAGRAGAAAPRVVIIPALGGKIVSLMLAGREWLWQSDVIPYPRPGAVVPHDASYVETADSGGYDECFPTVGACALPRGVVRWGGLALPDHGELWSQHARVVPAEGVAGGSGLPREAAEATLAWRGRRLPYRFERTVVVRAPAEVEMRYAVTSESDAPIPFVWSSHPLFPLGPGTRVELPEGARVRVYAQHGAALGGPLAEWRWPLVAGRDLRAPGSGGAYACKLFLDVREGRAALREGGATLEARWDVAELPNVGLWLNHGGWTPFADRAPYHNLALEPCIGAPDSLADALGAWKGAAWLAPGETRRWTLRWRAWRDDDAAPLEERGA
ncbi:MAG TPA: hypothetical protein VFS05_10705 [Gemmatimonadaceae bacterium]|nr:hypothetical protein [Gemmatimonadaceae bacterium]